MLLAFLHPAKLGVLMSLTRRKFIAFASSCFATSVASSSMLGAGVSMSVNSGAFANFDFLADKNFNEIQSNLFKIGNIVKKYGDKRIVCRFFDVKGAEPLFKIASKHGRFANFDISKKPDCLKLVSKGIVGQSFQQNAKNNLEVVEHFGHLSKHEDVIYECGTHSYNQLHLGKDKSVKSYLCDNISYQSQYFYFNGIESVSKSDILEIRKIGQEIAFASDLSHDRSLLKLKDQINMGSFEDTIIKFLNKPKPSVSI